MDSKIITGCDRKDLHFSLLLSLPALERTKWLKGNFDHTMHCKGRLRTSQKRASVAVDPPVLSNLAVEVRVVGAVLLGWGVRF